MKPRTPKTFAAAITTIKNALGEETCAAAVGRSESLIRKWADPDHESLPSLRQALALDVAYVKGGFGDPPLLLAYQFQISRTLAKAPEGPPVDLMIAALTVQGAVGDLSESIAKSRRADSPGGSEITPNERTTILTVLARLEEQIGDIEETLE